MSILERCPTYKESNKRSKERQGPTLGVRFTEVSVNRIIRSFHQLFSPEIPLKIAFIPSILRRLQRWREKERSLATIDANTTIIASEVIIASALALGNSRHFVTSPLVSPRNDQSRNVGCFSGYFCLGVELMNRD